MHLSSSVGGANTVIYCTYWGKQSEFNCVNTFIINVSDISMNAADSNVVEGGTHQGGSISEPGSSSSSPRPAAVAPPLSRYESQKRRDWNTFGQYLKNHRPPLALSRCSGAHVLEFLRYLDQFGKTKVHLQSCPFFGHPHPPAPCACPLRQAWGSLDALIGRLRAAYEEHGGKPESNPFGTRPVRSYLREVREHQSKARGIAYEKKKRKRPPPPQQPPQQQQQNPQPPLQPPVAPPGGAGGGGGVGSSSIGFLNG